MKGSLRNIFCKCFIKRETCIKIWSCSRPKILWKRKAYKRGEWVKGVHLSIYPKFKELTPQRNPQSDDGCVRDDFSVCIFMNNFIESHWTLCKKRKLINIFIGEKKVLLREQLSAFTVFRK